MFNFLKNALGGGNSTDYKSLVEKGAVIIDVRSQSEFNAGHIKGSKNIPVNDIKGRVGEIKKMNKPIITVCLSGGRSGVAKSILTASGVEAYNGGPWHELEKKI